MVADPKILAFQRSYAAAQAEARRLRTADFVDYAPVVCGIPLRPITLRTYTLLLAWGNGFVRGEAVGLKDIVQFVWLHHPGFGQFAAAARKDVANRVWRALHPRFPAVNAVVLFLRALPRFRWLRHFARPTAAARHAEVIAEIRRLLHEALRDFPPPDDDGEVVPFALQPQLMSLFIRGYGVDFVTASKLVDDLPLKQLVQFVREVMHRASKGKDKLLTPEEARIWWDYQGYKNEVVAAAATRN